MALAASAGLVLLPWQELVLDVALSEDGAGFCASFEVGLVVPRQNGKGGVLEAAELYWLFLDDAVELVTHTAHRFDTSLEHFNRIRALVETTPDLMAEVRRISDTNGKERIELKNGKRLQFKARAKGGGRGFSGDRVVLDEAFYITDLGSLIPTMSARPDPQLWWTSSAPLPQLESDALRRVIKRGRAGDIAYLEWSNVKGADLDDRAVWAESNPSLGALIDAEFVAVLERATLTDEEFGRERLGIFPDPDEDTEVPGWLVIGEDAWKACGTDETAKQSEKPGWLVGAVTLAVEVRPDRSSATVVAAGECREGGIGVEPVASGVGVGWIVAEVQALCERGDVATVVVDEGGPAGVLIDPLIAAGVDVTRVAFADVKQATAEFFDAVTAAEVVHRDRPELSEAVGWAQKRPAGDTWLIDRKGPHDACPLVAAVLARHGHLSQDRGGYALAFYV